MSDSGEKIYEMLWDCKFCGTPKLLGLTHRHCPNCGAPQDPTLRYFPSDAEKVAVQDHVYAGADLVCPACQTPNGAASNHCGNCGSPLDKSKAVHQRAAQVHGEGQAFAGETKEAARQELAGPPQPGAAALPTSPPRKKSWVMPVVLGGAFVVLALFFATCFWKKSVDLVVTGHAWAREVQIEQFAHRTESAWCDSMPPDATGVSRSREVRSTRQVADGETCTTKRVDKGNGTFGQSRSCTPKYRSESVYDEKCSYLVDRWGYERSEKAAGTSVKDNPSWPAVHLSRTGSPLGSEREGKRVETYTVKLTDSSKATHECTFDQPKWSSIRDGSKWSGKEGVLSGNLDCTALGPER